MAGIGSMVPCAHERLRRVARLGEHDPARSERGVPDPVRPARAEGGPCPGMRLDRLRLERDGDALIVFCPRKEEVSKAG
jgi:hypothetical protein